MPGDQEEEERRDSDSDGLREKIVSSSPSGQKMKFDGSQNSHYGKWQDIRRKNRTVH